MLANTVKKNARNSGFGSILLRYYFPRTIPLKLITNHRHNIYVRLSDFSAIPSNGNGISVVFHILHFQEAMKMKLLVSLLVLFVLKTNAQELPIKVVTEDIPNRLAFYAINENDQDVDVMLTLTGTNFRQSKGRPRLIRVPGT